MIKLNIVVAPCNTNNVEIKIIPDSYASNDHVYVMSDGVTLQDYAKEWKDKVRELESRYRYLERGRDWAIKNFRGLLK